MRNNLLLIGVGLIAALLVTVGCDRRSSNNSATQQSASPGAASASGAPGTQAHNNVDVWFVRSMIPHHQQGVTLCDIVLGKQGVDPRVIDMANRMKASQTQEIQQMQSWLSQWGNPQMPSQTPSMTPGTASQTEHAGMPGMLSDRELNALKQAQGHDASVMFLTQMISHHQGGIEMAHAEVTQGQFPPAVDMAKSILTTQQQQIDQMKQLLSSL